MNIPQTSFIYKLEAHQWTMYKVRIKQWHPIRVALLFRLGPKMPAPKLAALLQCHVSTLRRKAIKYGVELYQCHKKFDEWEIKFMRDKRQVMSQREIAEFLGRTEDTIRVTMRSNGIQPGRPFGERHLFCRYGKDEVELARKLSDVGLTSKMIAEKLELNDRTVRSWVNFEKRKHYEGAL
ncbi:probable regulatory domain [Serratia marcescens]|uniref:hypothetical protein n=1 Tax=Serratia marcescens TaxID=615 RepID=UPI00074529BF|nr:hypothetical protein [Serratia marcescens]CUZ07567.1 probable regulatory domain [Serratia marcescens]CUZ35717.1 probable regulatory domain [Serratia marcescens]CUZ78089.1 probable regulatory domain [Serratia marcescens]CUZ99360.1 probable regulatory domain [Serratia marcescens]CVB36580.1 probable regulatory domain [Serratia marcescens]